jgi:sterol desaturase/sphingolipid hydroxylase (fatty acid hydroxylase superfamily)
MKEYVRNAKGRMFESDFFELFSKVPPSAPFVFWIPIGIGISAFALATGVTTVREGAPMLPLGFFGWQVTEYFVHKHLFHWLGIGPISRRFHDIVHGFHHKYPDDGDRLVMPLAVSIGIASILGGALYFAHAPAKTVPLWVGVLAGYLFYDFMHWSTHFRKPRTKWGRKMRAHHMSHHFADIDTNFGISNRFMDVLLGTLKKRTREQQRVDDDGRYEPARRTPGRAGDRSR